MQFRLVLPVLSLFVALNASAQSFTPVRELKNLSPEATAKLHTLETLNALPGGDWHFHAGDIPHGESPTLDDSTWITVHAPTGRNDRTKAPKDAVWYRRTIEVPQTLNGYDITGARIWFQFQADANGPMPQIVYFNGRRVALGDDLEPIVLFEPAKPGDKILVAVKLLHTVDEKTFTGVKLRIEPSQSNGRPDPDDIRTQIITASNLLPNLTPAHPELLPRLEAAVAAVDMKALAAANQPGFDASLRSAQVILAELHVATAAAKVIEAGNSHIDAAWLWPRSETIDVVKRTFTTALQLMNEYPDYHYTQSAAQYSAWMADKYPDIDKQIKQRIKEGRWEIVGGMWVEPDLNLPGGESLVRQLLVGQRWFQHNYGVTARIGWNPDSFGYNWQLPQIYKRSGMDYFVTQKMHWNDTNVIPFRLFWWQSPDGSKVLTYFPTDYVHSDVNPTRISADFAESAQRNPGTTLHLDLYGIGDHGGGPTRSMLDQADKWIAAGKSSMPGAPSSPTASPSARVGSSSPGGSAGGSSGLQAAEFHPATSGALAPAYAVPQMRYGTAQKFFTEIEQHLNPTSPTWNYDSIARGYTAPTASGAAVGLPTWKDELFFEYHRGVQTSQAAHKRNMRTSESQTLDAEKLASLAWLTGQPYPADVLEENWKKITFNQFHDLAAGSGIAVIYRDAQSDYTEVAHADREISTSALSTLSAGVDTRVKNGVPIMLFNSLAWPREETTEVRLQLPETASDVRIFDASNALVLSQLVGSNPQTHQFTLLVHAKVPPLGYTILHAAAHSPLDAGAAQEQATDLKLDENPGAFILSNSHLRATVDKQTGCITSIKILPANTEFLAANACGNELQTYADNPKQYDAWNIDPGTLDGRMTPITNFDSIALTDNGPLRKTIRVTRTWQKSHFTQDISLDALADSIRISNDVSWHEDHVLLKAAFPLAATSAKATYEIPFGSIDRPTTRNNSWEKAQFEVPAQQWADLSGTAGNAQQGLSLINDSKYGYDGLNNTLRLTLLRAPTWPDPDADRGPQHFVYTVYPHAGPWKQALTVHRGYELNTPLSAQQVFPHTGGLPATNSFASVSNPNVVLTAVKKAEDANALIFRMYEFAGAESTVSLHIPTGAQSATETNLMEKPEVSPLNLNSDIVTVPIHPYEILTVQATYPK